MEHPSIPMNKLGLFVSRPALLSINCYKDKVKSPKIQCFSPNQPTTKRCFVAPLACMLTRPNPMVCSPIKVRQVGHLLFPPPV